MTATQGLASARAAQTAAEIEKATEDAASARAAQEAAETKRGEAVDARKALRSRVASGDESVSGADLADADQAVELADLRCQAAAAKVEKAEESLHQAEVDRLRADVKSLLDGGSRNERMDREVEKVAEAVAALIGEWRDQQAAIDELIQRAVRLAPLPQEFHQDGRDLRWNGRDVAIPTPDALLAALLGHIFNAERIRVSDSDLRTGLNHFTGGYSDPHRYPLGAVLHTYATDRVYELAGKQRWDGE